MLLIIFFYGIYFYTLSKSIYIHESIGATTTIGLILSFCTALHCRPSRKKSSYYYYNPPSSFLPSSSLNCFSLQ